MGILIALGILGAIGSIVTTIGNVMKVDAQAKADELKASQLEELSKTGGYYDQVMKSLNSDLKDIEADRAAAGKMLAIQSIQVSRQGAQAEGQIAATAGAGNLGQGGSVAIRKGIIETQVQEQLTISKMQYEDQLRGLATRKASTMAEETKVAFEKKTGTQEAGQLRSEADWLNTWGVGLTIAGGAIGAATSFFNPFLMAGVDPFANIGGGSGGSNGGGGGHSPGFVPA